LKHILFTELNKQKYKISTENKKSPEQEYMCPIYTTTNTTAVDTISELTKEAHV
jgi:hypothetical protein